MKLSKEFYSRDTITVAKDLLGKILVRKVDGISIKGKIIETEAYIGSIDKACHAYGGKRTPRIEPLYGEPGIAYVYFIYGMYFCFNVITKEKEAPEGVLIRAVEPICGMEYMAQKRFNKEFDKLNKPQITGLTNGPSKLCMAFNITKENTWNDLTDDDGLYIEKPLEVSEVEIVNAKRVGIDYSDEAKDFLWRFYIKNNRWVSKVNK